MIQITDITLRIAGRVLLDNASLTIPTGTKIGLVGRNGSGKTTLFKAITGDLASDTGAISFPKQARLGQVAQEAPGTDQSLIEIVLAADKERAALMLEAETETDWDKLAQIHTRLGDIDAHSAEARAARILAGLGFDNEAQQRAAREFSGGWRMRVALAAVLFANPDILLLDEPTNYLDLEGTLWLVNYLARYPGTVVIISHDRNLLNQAVDAIAHLDQKKLKFYRGNYDSFETQRVQAMELAGKAVAKQEAKRKHMMSFVERFRSKASKAKQAQSRLKALEKMAPLVALMDERSASIKFPDPKKPASSPIINLENVRAGYGSDNVILDRLDLRIDADDRIALLGANGNGKSTFAKLIADRLEYIAGGVTRAHKLKISMFAQHQMDDLHPKETPIEHVRMKMKGEPEAKVRARVAAMGLGAERMETRAENLSGGEKARLLLGLIAFDGPHLLILDEPTNHLDMESRQALIGALNEYNGAVILISHDRHLIEASVERLWIVRDGTVHVYDDDMETYAREITRGKPREKKNKAINGEIDGMLNSEKADREKQLAPLKKQISQAESAIANLNKKLENIDRELALPQLQISNPNRVKQLSRTRAKFQTELDTTEANWLSLSANFEAG